MNSTAKALVFDLAETQLMPIKEKEARMPKRYLGRMLLVLVLLLTVASCTANPAPAPGPTGVVSPSAAPPQSLTQAPPAQPAAIASTQPVTSAPVPVSSAAPAEPTVVAPTLAAQAAAVTAVAPAAVASTVPLTPTQMMSGTAPVELAPLAGLTLALVFPPDSNSVTVRGNVEGNATLAYTFTAQAGQVLALRVSAAGGPVTLALVGPSGDALYDASKVTDWSGTLDDGQYAVAVSNNGTATTNFTLQVALMDAAANGQPAEAGMLMAQPPAATAPDQGPLDGAAPEQVPDGTAQRIRFARGATSATVHGDLVPNGVDHWVIEVGAGRMMTVNLMPDTGDAILVIWAQDGTVLISDHAGATSWSGVVPHSEDYYIDVRNVSAAPLGYSLQVTIPPAPAPGPTVRRIQFAPGATSATVRGNVPGQSIDRWLIKAGAGQTMSVQLAPASGQVILVIYGADGTVLISDHAGATQWSGKLPKTQDYNVDVRSVVNAPTAYTLKVTIPPAPGPGPQPVVRRIQFAPGGTSATVNGRVAAGGVDRWVLGARAGQTMEVELDGNATLVIFSAGGTVLLSDHAGATSWAGALPVSGDYYIDVKSNGPSAYYALTVSIAPH
jgi:hypothetical protein